MPKLMKFKLSTWTFAFIVVAALLQPLHAQGAKSEVPTYLGRKIAQTMHYAGAAWLTRHEREQEEASLKMREELHLQPGMNVCDMGSGNGYHTIPMAKAVAPGGKAYAVDIQQPMLDMLEAAARQSEVTNIVSVLGAEDSPKLPEASCDLILLVDVYHEFSKPGPMLAGMKKALKPHGQIVLVEFRAEDNEVPIKPEHKMSKAQIMKEMTANGFTLSRSFDKLPWQHMMWFEAGQPAPASVNTPSPSK
ncbi:MAG: Methyltransferase type 11 [Verrucomicrobiaceae bacterium]|nr:Methyltransferase type 11 [Verrucomicrobiaceae bacterium]